ncbi:MAG: hypothetical protein GF408_08715 [Candidatus Omnitrophica bacterium]|nr:hypothetical protein [Candidatus Omnitrophota bacterium]
MREENPFLHNFWPKVISLILAVATWFYVFDLVMTDSYSKRQETAEQVLARSDLLVKEVPVRPVFYGESPDGYKVNMQDVKVEPATISIFGPKDVLEDVDSLKTDRIYLGEYTRSTILHLGLNSDSRFLKFENKVVEVYIPVEAVRKDK